MLLQHSPVVPSVDSIAAKIRSFVATGILQGDATRIHINPDCGLKTRKWEEVVPSLRNMVQAAAIVRQEMGLDAAEAVATRGETKTAGGAIQHCGPSCC